MSALLAITPRLASPASSSWIRPASAMSGTPRGRARAAIPAGALPLRLCSSSEPSPVMTRSAPSSASSTPVNPAMRSNPDSTVAPSPAIAPAATPPPAPAPGTCETSGAPPTCSACAQRPSASSSKVTSAGPAPFCGPNTAAAPSGPSSGFVTSVATATLTPVSRSRTGVSSVDATRDSVPPPSPTGAPNASSTPAPSAPSIPAPPSVLAVPPTVRTSRVAPCISASASSSPTPQVCAPSAVSGLGSTNSIPHARADSMYAVPSSTAYRALTASSSGPRTVSRTIRAPAASRTSSVPSPPSATGQVTISASGNASRTPSAIASAASTAVRLPLNLSGAMTTRVTASPPSAGDARRAPPRRCGPPARPSPCASRAWRTRGAG